MSNSKLKIALDRTDRRILDELQKDGAISNLDLADKVGLSPSPCSRRVKALQESGIIQKTVAVLDQKALGLDMVAMISISMDRHTPERFENFETLVANFPEVLECYLITGSSADYLLKVIVQDMEGYQQFLLGKLTRIEGVSGVHSSFVMRKVVDSSRLPVSL
ncbi:AsnC family transcriptional regulator [Oleispira antarctica]|uniref:AsnC family transcriptional regulator n=1 Tax=Oleispira antarctica TaxID=188908 RepID=A0A1Y5HW14_OLEAN|nr:AsnC family transcriptional regulator [Oleispira antarctica]